MAFDDDFKLAYFVIDGLNWYVHRIVFTLVVDWSKIWTLLRRNGSKPKRSRVYNHVARVRPILDRCSTLFAHSTLRLFLWHLLLSCKLFTGRTILLDNWGCKLFEVPEKLFLLRWRIDCLEDKYYDLFHCSSLLWIIWFPTGAPRILPHNHSVIKAYSTLLWIGVLLHEISDRQAQVVNHLINRGEDFIDRFVEPLVVDVCSKRLHCQELKLKLSFADRIDSLLHFLIGLLQSLLITCQHLLSSIPFFFSDALINLSLSEH